MQGPLSKTPKKYYLKSYVPRPRGFTVYRKTKLQLLNEHIRLNDTLTTDDLASMSYSYMIDKVLKGAEKRNNVLITKISPNKWVIER